MKIFYLFFVQKITFNNASCPTVVMRFLLLNFLIFLGTMTYAQFDRVNSDPLSISPSFAGSSGKSRISNEFINLNSQYSIASSPYINKLTYDGFFSKIKGGVGISFYGEAYKRLIDKGIEIDRYGFDIAYSPKLSFINEITWAPSISLGYLRDTWYEYVPWIAKDLFIASLGLMRNSEKVFYGFEYNIGLNHQVLARTQMLNLHLGVKFDRRKLNAWSSTLLAQFQRPVNIFRYKAYDSISPIYTSIKEQVEPFRGAQFYFEYTLKYKSLELILSNRNLGIGFKRPRWGINLKGNYKNFLPGNVLTFYNRFDRYWPYQGYSVGISAIF